jgi:hypothetical protein
MDLRVHRRANLPLADFTVERNVPVTRPVRTLVDLTVRVGRAELEAAINAADRHDLVDPESLRAALEPLAGRPGVGRLRGVLDRRTFVLTDSELERRFLPLAGGGAPATDVSSKCVDIRPDAGRRSAHFADQPLTAADCAHAPREGRSGAARGSHHRASGGA